MTATLYVQPGDLSARLSPIVGIASAYTGARREKIAMIDDFTHSSGGDVTSELALGDDLITGAEQIARELQWKMRDGRWNRRRVYHLAAQGEVPIYRVKGLGICARKSALRRYFNSLDERTLRKLKGDNQGQRE